MKLTVLVDLDNTLLSNEDDVFIPAYLQRLAEAIGVRPADQVLKLLWFATGEMVKKTSPAETLKEVFDQHFFPLLGASLDELTPVINHFYAEEYPALKPLTQPRPEAVRFIDKAFSLGYTVAVATNPILPRAAIDHRLSWAGFPPAQYPFDLITSYENMHFSKPHPEYLVEILAQLGWPNQPVVVVGNSLKEDILPAVSLGLPVFFLSDQPLPSDITLPSQSQQGDVTDLTSWLENLNPQEIHEEFTGRPASLAILRAVPAALDTLTRSLSNDQLRKQPAPAEWSLTEIACHLRDVDREVNLPRFQRLLTDETPFLVGVNTDLWAAERQYQLQSGQCAVKEFLTVRIGLLDLLSSFSEDAWKRPAKHAIFGPTCAEELISFIATHDENHLAQAAAVLHTISI